MSHIVEERASERACVRELEKLPALAICSRQYITFGAERSLKQIHTAQDNNHFQSLKKMVLNVGFHKALEIPWPDPPLSAFHALCSKDFDIRIIFEDMLEISSKKLSRCQILHEMTNRRWQTRSRGNVNDKVRPASTRTLSLCILWIM